MTYLFGIYKNHKGMIAGRTWSIDTFESGCVYIFFMNIQYMLIYCMLLLLVIVLLYNLGGSQDVEHYWDIGPYKLYNNIYRCALLIHMN